MRKHQVFVRDLESALLKIPSAVSALGQAAPPGSKWFFCQRMHSKGLPRNGYTANHVVSLADMLGVFGKYSYAVGEPVPMRSGTNRGIAEITGDDLKTLTSSLAFGRLRLNQITAQLQSRLGRKYPHNSAVIDMTVMLCQWTKDGFGIEPKRQGIFQRSLPGLEHAADRSNSKRQIDILADAALSEIAALKRRRV